MVHKRNNGGNNQMCHNPDNNQIIKGMKRFLVFLLALMVIVHTPAPLPIHKTITRHPLQHLITLESAMKSLAKGPMPKPPISIFSIRLRRRKIPELIWREWWEMQENGCMTVHKSVNAKTITWANVIIPQRQTSGHCVYMQAHPNLRTSSVNSPWSFIGRWTVIDSCVSASRL